MILEKDLQEAISECQGVRHPNANTCLKLAAYYTIQDHLFSEQKNAHKTNDVIQTYSYAASNDEHINAVNEISYGDSEFYRVIKDKDMNDVLVTMNELMDTIKIINPKLYNGVISKLLY